MKKNRLVLIISSCMCVVLAGIVMAIAFLHTPYTHKHKLGEAKTYHVHNDGIYYTRLCQDGCEVAFETKASLNDVMSTVTAEDKIVLDEDVTLTEEVLIKSFSGAGDDLQELELNINFDLNNFTLSTNIDTTQNDSLFMFNANRGKVVLNVKNGKIESQDVSYIFRFKNNRISGENIEVNIDNLECEVTGIQATPLFASECMKMKLNANNSKFVSCNSGTYKGDYGVGVFINSDSEFNFNKCYFEGGDAVYVKSGIVNLNGCHLVNAGLASHTSQSVDTFSAVGACLVADNYATKRAISQYAITIENCSMESRASFKMIYVIESGDKGVQLGVNENSILYI